MTDLDSIIWNICAIVGIACILTMLGGLLVLWFAIRSEAKRWRALQDEAPKKDPRMPGAPLNTWHDGVLRYNNRTDAAYTVPVVRAGNDIGDAYRSKGPMLMSRINWPNNGRRF